MPLKKCCFCVDLRTGSLIVGYLNLVGLVLLFIFALIDLTYYVSVNHSRTVIAISLDIAVIMISSVFTVGLLFCIHQNTKHEHIRNFLYFNAMMLVLHVIQFIASSFVLYIAAREIVIFILSTVLTIYFLLVIGSYWTTLRPGNQTQNTHQPTAPYPHQVPVAYPAQVIITDAPGQVHYSGNNPPPMVYSDNAPQVVFSGNPDQVGYSAYPPPPPYKS